MKKLKQMKKHTLLIGIIAVVFGILVLLIPGMLRLLVGIFLIVYGILLLVGEQGKL